MATQALLVKPGEKITIHDEKTMHLSFDTSHAEFQRADVDLVILLPGSEPTVIRNFFVTQPDGNLPSFRLADGTEVAGKDFLLGYEPDFDISTAAGPESASDSSGLSNYTDTPGQLIQGVNRLDSLHSTTETSGKEELATSALQAEPLTETAKAETGGAGPVPFNHDDRIIINAAGQTITTFIHGDSIPKDQYIFLEDEEYSVGGPGRQTLEHEGDQSSIIIGDNIYATPEENVWGNDTIQITAKEVSGNIYGGLGNDSIQINATVAASDSGIGVLGDEFYLPEGVAGEDTISVQKLGEGGQLFGDVYELSYTAQGGNDSLSVSVNSGSVYGDAAYLLQEAQGGDDTIRVDTLSGSIYGEANEMIQNAKGGDDSISVGVMEKTEQSDEPTITGDANTLYQSSWGGDDYIRVDTFKDGTIYGDAQYLRGTARAGNDTISIGELDGDGEKAIYGDGGTLETGATQGTNVFLYDNAAGHQISLDGQGNVTIMDQAGTDITAQTNTTISGFSGIGGGSGDDSLSGGTGNDFLVASYGEDAMTGGAGADTFHWNKGFDYGKGVTTIKDFSSSDNDKIRLGDLLDDKGNFSMDKALEKNFSLSFADDGDKNLLLSMDGTNFAQVHFSEITVGSTHYENHTAFYDAYSHSNSSEQQAMLQAVMGQLLGA